MKTEKDGKIIIDALRPMSTFPKEEWVIAQHKRKDKLSPVLQLDCYSDNLVGDGFEAYSITEFIGWIPVPIYQPATTPAFYHGSDIQEKDKSAQEYFTKVAG